VSLLPFGPPKVFRILGGCGTRASASASALKHPRRPKIAAHIGRPWDSLECSSMLWLKAPFARNPARGHLFATHLARNTPASAAAKKSCEILQFFTSIKVERKSGSLTLREKEEAVAICDHLKSPRFSSYLPLAFTELKIN